MNRPFISLVICYFLISLLRGADTQSIDQILTRKIDTSFMMYNRHEYKKMSDYLKDIDFTVTKNDSVHLDYYYALSMSYGHQREYEKYFEAIVEGLMLAQKSQNRWMLLSLHREFASFHDEHLDDFESSLKYFEEATKYLDAVDSLSKTGLMMDIGLTCVNAEEYDKAATYYQRAFDFLPTFAGILTYDLYTFYTPYLLETGQPDSAISYATKAYQKWEELGFIGGAIETACDIAEGYLDLDYPSKALEYIDIAYDHAKQYDNIHYYVEVLDLMADVQEENGMLIESQRTFSELAIMQDSIDMLTANDKIDKLRIEFLTSKFKDEVAAINAYNETLNETIKKERNTYKYIISLFGIALLLVGIFYARRKRHIKDLTTNLELTKSEYERLKNEYLLNMAELEKNKRKLTSNALFLEKKDETLRTLRKMLVELKGSENHDVNRKIFSATKLADQSIKIDNNWESFRYFFEQVYPTFNRTIKETYPQLNANELRVISYIKMGLTDKEASRLLGINTASFQKSKYRLKKKLNVQKEGSLNDIVQDLELTSISN